IEAETGLNVDCKWPNDILYKGKKVAGILIEGSVKQNAVDYVVIGIGVNVNQVRFDGELSTKASSLRMEARKEIDRAVLFREILKGLESDYMSFQTSGFQSVVPQWLARSSMVNRTISISQQGNTISGVVKGLSADGGLVLQTNGAEKTVFAGDVTVLQV
ncbi:MAG: biotin--[acetyl-CoA-carboxylase] ligase, partial [Bacteroidota bacterium]